VSFKIYTRVGFTESAYRPAQLLTRFTIGSNNDEHTIACGPGRAADITTGDSVVTEFEKQVRDALERILPSLGLEGHWQASDRLAPRVAAAIDAAVNRLIELRGATNIGDVPAPNEQSQVEAAALEALRGQT
jgi:hypothetical protein